MSDIQLLSSCHWQLPAPPCDATDTKLSWSAETDRHYIQDNRYSANEYAKIAATLFQESCSEPIMSLSVCGHIPFKDRFPQK